MEVSLFEITRANCICNSELPLRFLRERLLYFDFVVMCDTKVNEFFSHFYNFLV